MSTLGELFAYQIRTITQSDTTEYDPPLRHLIISEVGTVTVVNEKDDSVPIVIPTGASLPAVIPVGRVSHVMSTGTDVADANILATQ